MKILGSPIYLNNPDYEAELAIDLNCPDNSIWIMPPRTIGMFNLEEIAEFCCTIKILASPKNMEQAKLIVETHNAIRNSPLAKALNEKK